MAWRVAKALDTLRSQVNSFAPNRSKKADGTIGDAAHQSRSSDHNPWIREGSMGVVSALDLTHHPAGGFDSYKLAEHFRIKRDVRIKYVISNKRIYSSTTSPWQWRKYTGSNPHSSHVHISVKATKAHYDSTAPWDIQYGGGGVTPPPVDPSARPVLRRGSVGDAVSSLQVLLKINVDGNFGPITENAVIAFQRANGLTVDGIVGPRTWAALEAQST